MAVDVAGAAPLGSAATRTVPVVLNGAAGTLLEQPDAAQSLHDLFAAHGLAPDLVDPDAPLPDRMAEALRRAGPGSLVVVAGGDGTVACAASALAGTGAVLGLLPFGTMNLLAHDLGIPVGDTAAAVRLLAEGVPRLIDVGDVNGSVFLCASMLGLPTKLGRHREFGRRRRLPPWRMWPGFLRAAIRGMAQWRPLDVTLAANGRTTRLVASSLTVTVNPLDDGSGRMFGRTVLDGGRLGVYSIRTLSPGAVLRLAARLLAGRWKQDANVSEVELDALDIGSPRPLRVMNDGESALLDPPLRYRVRPRALRVMVPAP